LATARHRTEIFCLVGARVSFLYFCSPQLSADHGSGRQQWSGGEARQEFASRRATMVGDRPVDRVDVWKKVGDTFHSALPRQACGERPWRCKALLPLTQQNARDHMTMCQGSDGHGRGCPWPGPSLLSSWTPMHQRIRRLSGSARAVPHEHTAAFSVSLCSRCNSLPLSIPTIFFFKIADKND
jgi:hypothetical protein